MHLTIVTLTVTLKVNYPYTMNQAFVFHHLICNSTENSLH